MTLEQSTPVSEIKVLSSTFQPTEEGKSVLHPKFCDKHGDKDEDNSQKNVNNDFRNVSSILGNSVIFSLRDLLVENIILNFNNLI